MGLLLRRPRTSTALTVSFRRFQSNQSMERLCFCRGRNGNSTTSMRESRRPDAFAGELRSTFSSTSPAESSITTAPSVQGTILHRACLLRPPGGCGMRSTTALSPPCLTPHLPSSSRPPTSFVLCDEPFRSSGRRLWLRKPQRLARPPWLCSWTSIPCSRFLPVRHRRTTRRSAWR